MTDRDLPRGWRPLPGRRRDRPPAPIADSIERVARRLGAPPPSALAAVFGAWERTVGEQVAAHSRPVSLVDGVLTVVVDQPGWATQLRYLSATLLERLGEVAGEGVVTRLDVRVGRR